MISYFPKLLLCGTRYSSGVVCYCLFFYLTVDQAAVIQQQIAALQAQLKVLNANK
jgi:hypothetical protein